MAKEGKKHKADKGDKGAKGDHHKKSKEGKDGKRHSTAEHKRKHSKGKTPPSSGDESRTSVGDDAYSGQTTWVSDPSGSEPDTSDVEAGLSGKSSKKSVEVKTSTHSKQTSDGAKDVHPAGRFCLLLGSFALMAGMIYLVMQVYVWVGRSEKIFREIHPVEVDVSKNPASAAMEKAYKL